MAGKCGEMSSWTGMSLKTSPSLYPPLRFRFYVNVKCYPSFCGGPLLGIFSNLRRQEIPTDVQTLVLDGLSVTADLVSEIICLDSLNARILPIREVQNLNERKLQQALYAIRPSRPSNTPQLEALYFFGPKENCTRVPLSQTFQ
jgi:hypothetical protein